MSEDIPAHIKKMLEFCKQAKRENRRIVAHYKAPHRASKNHPSPHFTARGLVHSINAVMLQINVDEGSEFPTPVPLDMVQTIDYEEHRQRKRHDDR